MTERTLSTWPRTYNYLVSLGFSPMPGTDWQWRNELGWTATVKEVSFNCYHVSIAINE